MLHSHEIIYRLEKAAVVSQEAAGGAAKGPLAEYTASGGRAAAAESSDAQQQQQQQFTHGVLFRYGSEGAMAAFQRQPRVSLMLGGTGTPEAEELVTVSFRGAVPSELEAVFRRGEEWEEGLELAAGLALAPGGSEADAAEFLSLAAQLATSSAYGAVQASWGPCLGVSGGGGSLQQPDWVLLVRFQEPEALQRFLACPPIAALLEGSELSPLRTLWHGALQIAPTEQTQQEQKGRGGLI